MEVKRWAKAPSDVPPDEASRRGGTRRNDRRYRQTRVHRPREGHTISEVCDFFLRALRVKESTATNYSNNVELYIRPLLGHRVAKDLTRQDVEAFAAFLSKPLQGDFLKVKSARRAVTNGGEASDWEARMAGKPTGSRTVSATLTLLTMILNYAAESKWIRSNPAAGVPKKTSGVRRVDKHKVLDKAEARKLIEATRDRCNRPVLAL